MKKIIIALSLILFPAMSFAAAAQCNAQSVGLVSCMANKQCECKFFRKSEMAATPDRFDWDCSLLRPSCDDNYSVNAPNNTPAYNGPSSVGISKSNTKIVQAPVTTNTQAQSPTTTLHQEQQSPTTTNTSTTTQTPTQTSTQTDNQNSTQTNH